MSTILIYFTFLNKLSEFRLVKENIPLKFKNPLNRVIYFFNRKTRHKILIFLKFIKFYYTFIVNKIYFELTLLSLKSRTKE